MAYSAIFLSNLDEIKNRRGNTTSTALATLMGIEFPMTGGFCFYYWQNESTAVGDDWKVIHPTLGGHLPGRWFRVPVYQVNSDWDSTAGMNQILNKPTQLSQFTNDQHFISNISSFSTTDLAEGTNLYYTNARFNTAFAGKSTSNLSEGTNLYFTNARSRSSISLTNTGTGIR